jgi:hypothetical protein
MSILVFDHPGLTEQRLSLPWQWASSRTFGRLNCVVLGTNTQPDPPYLSLTHSWRPDTLSGFFSGMTFPSPQCMLNAEFFKRASDSNDADGPNNFGIVLRGAMALMKTSNARLYNVARCLEYGKGIDQDSISAAKYDHLSAELSDADAQNSFGICLERGIGVQSKLALAALY